MKKCRACETNKVKSYEKNRLLQIEGYKPFIITFQVTECLVCESVFATKNYDLIVEKAMQLIK